MVAQKPQTINNGISNGKSQSIALSEQLLSKSNISNKNFRAISEDAPDIVCLSHLRWNFVYQRPQHLLSRCAAGCRVFFIEEPIFTPEEVWRLEVTQDKSGVWVVVPHLPQGLSDWAVNPDLKVLIHQLFIEYDIHKYICWYYTPMALAFTNHLKPEAVVYDCMDELAAFQGASTILKDYEAELFQRADLVFTGGQSLYESKVNQHKNVYAFPSSVDVPHFAQGRTIKEEPADQANIPHPRLGFFGVIDERMDIDLLAGIASARPDWHLVIIGPVVKIDPATLPQYENIHYLGGKDYQDLPAYLSGWDLAMLPFARNSSTRFISPTKTPEYLAGGKPVVSTSIKDVVRPYADLKLVRIADTALEFVLEAEKAMQEDTSTSGWLSRVDAFLEQISWDRTWNSMMQLIDETLATQLQGNGKSLTPVTIV
jgi:UDP-galactopyranose mutase